MNERDEKILLEHILESIAHIEQYTDNLNLQVVWDTVHNNLPPLKERLADLLKTIQTS